MVAVEPPNNPPVPEVGCGCEDPRPENAFELGCDVVPPPRLLKMLGCWVVRELLRLLNSPPVCGCGVDAGPLPRLLNRLGTDLACPSLDMILRAEDPNRVWVRKRGRSAMTCA